MLCSINSVYQAKYLAPRKSLNQPTSLCAGDSKRLANSKSLWRQARVTFGIMVPLVDSKQKLFASGSIHSSPKSYNEVRNLIIKLSTLYHMSSLLQLVKLSAVRSTSLKLSGPSELSSSGSREEASRIAGPCRSFPCKVGKSRISGKGIA